MKLRKFILKNKKKLLVIVSILLIITIGTTYSYFAVVSGYIKISTKVQSSKEIDTLDFTEGDSLALTMSKENLALGGTDLSASTDAYATLTKNSEGDAIFATYDVYLRVGTNTFEYSDYYGLTPELILTIIDPEGNEIKELDGLDYVTSESGVSGFDVTTQQNSVLVFDNYYIQTGDVEMQTWTLTLTVINLDVNQAENMDKTFSAYLIFSESSGINWGEMNEDYLVYNILMNNSEDENANSLEEAVASIEAKDEPDFNTTAITDEGMFATLDDYGTSYYFRGAVEDNYVVWGGYFWRIVRIDGQGNVKLIYAGVYDEETDPSELTGEDLMTAGAQVFNSTRTYSYNVGYVYTVGELHGSDSSSTMKTALEAWYETNLSNYESQVAIDALYCIDRTSYTSSSTLDTTQNYEYTSEYQYFGAYKRLLSAKTPSLECTNELDALTWDESNEFINVLSSPVGLISADEAAFAGGKYNVANSAYYLYAGFTYWTLSPSYFYSSHAGVWGVYSTGSLNYSSNITYGVTASYGARLAVSLKSDILIVSGSGTSEDPYVIESPLVSLT